MPSRQDILRQIQRLAPPQLERSLHPEDRLVEDLGLDSVGLLTLAVEVEDHFRVCLDPEDEAGIRTVEDLVRTVEAKLRDR